MPAVSVLVETESGSLYLFELDRDGTLWVTRVSDPGRPGWSERLRRDGERIRLLMADPPVIGKPWLMSLDLRGDGVITYRYTTPIVSVRETEEMREP